MNITIFPTIFTINTSKAGARKKLPMVQNGVRLIPLPVTIRSAASAAISHTVPYSPSRASVISPAINSQNPQTTHSLFSILFQILRKFFHGMHFFHGTPFLY